jgi:hypothetical protein
MLLGRFLYEVSLESGLLKKTSQYRVLAQILQLNLRSKILVFSPLHHKFPFVFKHPKKKLLTSKYLRFFNRPIYRFLTKFLSIFEFYKKIFF